MRRIPVQLFDSGTALALAVLATVVDLAGAAEPSVRVFVGAYVAARRLLFALRDLP